MSKCGLCGEDFGSGSHQILKCRAKRVVPKVIYDRVCAWMANVESTEEFYESFDQPEEAEVWLKEEAFDIMYEIQNIYNGEEYK